MNLVTYWPLQGFLTHKLRVTVAPSHRAGVRSKWGQAHGRRVQPGHVPSGRPPRPCTHPERPCRDSPKSFQPPHTSSWGKLSFFFFNWSIIALSFPGVSVVKNLPSSAGDTGLIPGWGRSSGEGNGNPLQDSCLGKSHGQRSLAGYSPRGCKGLDMTERLNNNRIVALQCCVSFCRTTNWISYILTYISSLFSCPPPTPPSHSSRSSQSRKFYLTHWRESSARCLNRSA